MQDNTESLSIPGPAGTIEAELSVPTTPRPCLFVMCHPHPLYQGSMDNKVVTSLVKTMNELNCVSLRFNYRGIGKSTGSYGAGLGEIEDTLAVIRYLRQRFNTDIPLVLGGFSFGGYIAYQVALLIAPKALILVSPSVVHGNLYTEQEPECPTLVVQGASDEIVPAPAVLDWLKTRKQSFTLHQLADTSHFFHGKLMPLRQLSQKFMLEILDAPF